PHMLRSLIVLIVAAVAAVAVAVPVGARQALDCADFAGQREAQVTLNADHSDPENLDGDGDGIACEDFFGGIGMPLNGSDVSAAAEDTAGDVTDLPDTGVGHAANPARVGPYAVFTAVLCSLICALLVARRQPT
nr:excalibur calcium-binding domain-containing protein [Chloroflexia bacterium]